MTLWLSYTNGAMSLKLLNKFKKLEVTVLLYCDLGILRVASDWEVGFSCSVQYKQSLMGIFGFAYRKWLGRVGSA